jgi:hypothetical protein
MIIGSYSLDPRRIVTANYTVAKGNLYLFKIGYVIGSELMDITQIGRKKECIEWLELANTVIGKGPLIDAISNHNLDDEIDDDDDDTPTAKRKIGFSS